MWLRLNGPWVRIWLQELGGAYGGPSGIFIWICLVFFFLILGDVAFPRCRNSLSQHPSSPAKTLLLYHLPLIKHRDPGCPPHVLFSSSFLHSQELALSSPAWDGQCHWNFFSFSLCTSQSKRVLPSSPCPGQEDPESKNSECVSLCLSIRCHLKIWKESCSCTCLKYVRHLKFFKQTS